MQSAARPCRTHRGDAERPAAGAGLREARLEVGPPLRVSRGRACVMNASSWHSYLICPVGSRAIARAACAVQLVVEPTVNPGLSCSVVVPWLDSLAQHVRVVATEAHNLLFEPAIRAIHQLAITGIPDVVAARECSRDAIARRLDGMVADWFGVERRQLAMPID